MTSKLELLKAAFESKKAYAEIIDMTYDEEILKDISHIKQSHYENGNGLNWELYDYLAGICIRYPHLLEHIEYAHNHKGSLYLFFNKSGEWYLNNRHLFKPKYGEDWRENWYLVGERDDDTLNLITHVRDFDCHFLEMYREEE